MRRRLLAFLCLLTSACAPPNETPKPAAPKRWSTTLDELDRVPLCVLGFKPDDVWIAGGGLGAGTGALLMRGDGRAYREVTTGRSETIWWLGGTSASDVWAVGERGLALHFDGVDWTETDSGTTATLFGVWAAAPDDVWAVGGSPAGSGPNAVLLHWSGATWAAVAPPTSNDATYFKVWGSASNDVHLVGTSVAAHYDGATWTSRPVPVNTVLFTVHGSTRGVFAVGGGPPTILRWDGASWLQVGASDRMSGILSGVSVDGGGTTFVVGERHQRYRIFEDGAVRDDSDTGDLWPADLHSVWSDGQGNAVAVGGNYMALASPGAKPRGIVLRYSE